MPGSTECDAPLFLRGYGPPRPVSGPASGYRRRVTSLAPQDATRFWLSRRVCNDLFLLYCFTDTGRSSAQLRAEVVARAAAIPDLCVRLRERRFGYPAWVPRDISDRQIVEHEPAMNWPDVLAALADLLPAGVRADVCPWRLHVFTGVSGAPGGDTPALVAVLQLSHALADGVRAAAIARALWCGPVEPPSRPDAAGSGSTDSWTIGRWLDEAVALLGMPSRVVRTVIRGIAAERARRKLAECTARGEIPPPAPNFPPTLLNRPPAPRAHAVRMIVRDDLRVPSYTVTVLVLTAISLALSRYLSERGEPAPHLAAQVSMALPVDSRVRNNYLDLGIELPLDEPDLHRRADRIAATLEARRARARHPLLRAQARVTEVLPAPVLRRDISGYPLDLVPDALSGHTVVSSVHRGPADLAFGGGEVRWTAGFPALGAVMHLTHGVHGLGDTVTVSVHADPAVVPDIDAYAALVGTALTETTTALRS